MNHPIFFLGKHLFTVGKPSHDLSCKQNPTPQLDAHKWTENQVYAKQRHKECVSLASC